MSYSVSSGPATPVLLIDEDGNPYVASGGGGGGGGAVDNTVAGNGDPAPSDMVVVGGVDGGNAHFLKTDNNGRIVLGGSTQHIGQVGGHIANPSASFTRPANTTAYASGQLVANSTVAASVSALSFTAARVAAGSFILRKIKLHKSGTSTTNASFRVHFFRATPSTITNGDGGVFSVSGVADYLGAMDVTMDRAFTDGAVGFGVPMVGSELSVKLASGTTIVALIEARAAYTPISQEVFTLTLEDLQD